MPSGSLHCPGNGAPRRDRSRQVKRGPLVSRQGIIQAIVDAAMISDISTDGFSWPEST